MYKVQCTVALLLCWAPTLQHFISLDHPCYLAYTCNHTRTAVCGSEKTTADKKVFLDECSLLEHNCDHNKDKSKNASIADIFLSNEMPSESHSNTVTTLISDKNWTNSNASLTVNETITSNEKVNISIEKDTVATEVQETT